MKFCPNCGSKVASEAATSCSSCGFTFKVSDAQSTLSESEAVPVVSSDNAPAPDCHDESLTETPIEGANAADEAVKAVSDEGVNAPAPTYKTNGLAIASLVLGIVAFFGDFLFFIPSILAIIFGVVGMVKAKSYGNGKGMAIAGLVLGIVALIVTVIIIMLALSIFGFVVSLPGIITDALSYAGVN